MKDHFKKVFTCVLRNFPTKNKTFKSELSELRQ